MKLTIVEKKTYLAGLQCTLTSSCAKTSSLTDIESKEGNLLFMNSLVSRSNYNTFSTSNYFRHLRTLEPAVGFDVININF